METLAVLQTKGRGMYHQLSHLSLLLLSIRGTVSDLTLETGNSSEEWSSAHLGFFCVRICMEGASTLVAASQGKPCPCVCWEGDNVLLSVTS